MEGTQFLKNCNFKSQGQASCSEKIFHDLLSVFKTLVKMEKNLIF